MRTLVNRERNAVHEFLDEIAEQLATARQSTDRATDGRSELAHIELDFAWSAVNEISDLTEVLTGYLNRLMSSTVKSKEATSGHGITPPRHTAYVFEDDTDDEATDATTADDVTEGVSAA